MADTLTSTDEFFYDTSRSHLQRAKDDIHQGLGMWRMWVPYGINEIRRRYRRTFLGPLWASLSMAIFITALGLVWSKLWGTELKDFFPYITAGLIPWTLISTCIGGGCTVFIGNAPFLTQIRLPYTLFVFQTVWINLVTFIHHLTVYLGVALFFSVPLSFFYTVLVTAFGIILVALNMSWITVVLGTIGTRYRDVAQVVGSILTVMIFITPILWLPKNLGDSMNAWLFINLNPIHHFVDVIRAPLLGGFASPITYAFNIIMIFAGWALALLLLTRYRSRLVFWV